MAVKIRLKRVGTKKKPFYRVVAVDSRKKRDGEVLEWLGQYQPLVKADQFVIDEAKTLQWLNNGAQPTEIIHRLLKKSGLWQKFQTGK